MAVHHRALERFNRTAANPPLVVRWAAVPIAAFLTFAMAERRGWPYGLAAAVVYGGLSVSMALRPHRTVHWSRTHPVADAALLGPIAFLTAAYFTDWSVWWCLLVGAVGLVVGVGRGLQRKAHGLRGG